MTGRWMMRPGIGLLRRLPLGGKLAVLGVLAVLAQLVLWWSPSGWVALAGALLLGYLLLALYLGQSASLQRITQTMELVTQGDLRARAAIDGGDELARGEVTVKSLRDGQGAQVLRSLTDVSTWAPSLQLRA